MFLFECKWDIFFDFLDDRFFWKDAKNLYSTSSEETTYWSLFVTLFYFFALKTNIHIHNPNRKHQKNNTDIFGTTSDQFFTFFLQVINSIKILILTAFKVHNIFFTFDSNINFYALDRKYASFFVLEIFYCTLYVFVHYKISLLRIND